jgi:hypothetical protein
MKTIKIQINHKSVKYGFNRLNLIIENFWNNGYE